MVERRGAGRPLGWLDRPAAELAAPLLAQHASPEQAATAGDVFGPYRVIRELGRGGFATVYLAQDARHERQVALKLFHPGVAASLGRQRFLREIKLAARLQHPHILPVFDSGESPGTREAGAWLWYAMPYVAGETLRHRLARESRLSLAEAVRITREVALALDYAHREGVIHRDIKPANILLADGQALVADFGIARALYSDHAAEAPGGEDTLTEAGLTLGTPAYISPEQAVGGTPLDGRSDIYSLGCVLYEMLAGEPPYFAPTPVAMIARRLSEPPPPLRATRPDLPASVDGFLTRALARDPSDRFQSAGELAQALDALVTGHLAGDSTRGPRVRSSRPRARIAAYLLVGALAISAGFLFRGYRRTGSLDPGVVAVVPFRVTAADSEIRGLGEGMVDLLYAKLTGDAGFRAVDPRAVLSAWHQAAGSAGQAPTAEATLGLARRLGAGHLLLGQIVQLRQRLTVSASMVDARSGRTGVGASVEGPIDSVGALVDQLSADLLALRLGEGEERLDALRGYSWQALQAYITGRTAERDGRYAEARRDFAHALQFDSTFALAAAAQVDVSEMVDEFDLSGGQEDALHRQQIRTLAFALRPRLSLRDRILLEAQIGHELGHYAQLTEPLSRWEAATQVAPDRADAWAGLADMLFHSGPLLGTSDHRRAIAGFERALALDSSFAFPLEHLIDLAAETGDTARVRSLTTTYLERHPASELADYIRWRAGVALQDDSLLRGVRSRLPETSLASLQRIAGWGQLLGARLPDAGQATEIMLARAGNQAEYGYAVSARAQFLANRGRVREALSFIRRAAGAPPWLLDIYHIAGALYYGLDTSGVETIARRLERFASSGQRSAAPADRAGALCTAARWRVSTGDTGGVGATIGRLRALARADEASGRPGSLIGAPVLCADILAAMVAPVRPGHADGVLARLDSIMRTGPGFIPERDIANLVLAQLLERQGDVSRALAAVRRRWYNYQVADLWYLPAYLWEEGRLAAAAGDRTGAIRAYQHYLALVAEPDSGLEPAVREARAELTRLLAERPE